MLRTDSLRQYGDNYLRHSQSGLWELKIKRECLSKRRSDRQTIARPALLSGESLCRPDTRNHSFGKLPLSFSGSSSYCSTGNWGKNVVEEFRDEIYGTRFRAHTSMTLSALLRTPVELPFGTRSGTRHAGLYVGRVQFIRHLGGHKAQTSLLIGRNFDFYVGDAFAQKTNWFLFMNRNKAISSLPWMARHDRWLSGMNETGLTVTINAAKSAVPTGSATRSPF